MAEHVPGQPYKFKHGWIPLEGAAGGRDKVDLNSAFRTKVSYGLRNSVRPRTGESDSPKEQIKHTVPLAAPDPTSIEVDQDLRDAYGTQQAIKSGKPFYLRRKPGGQNQERFAYGPSEREWSTEPGKDGEPYMQYMPSGVKNNVAWDGSVAKTSAADNIRGAANHLDPESGYKGSLFAPTESKLSGDGVDVGDHIDLSRLPSDKRDEAQRALNAIAATHGDGNLPDIPMRMFSEPDRSEEAAYHPGDFNDAAGDFIDLNVKAKQPALTLTHEVGHFLDNRGIGGDNGGLESEIRDEDTSTGKAMTKFLRAAGESQSFQDGMDAYDKFPNYQDYWTSPPEVWARAYAQYVANKSADPVMMKQLRKAQADGVKSHSPNSTRAWIQQWQEADWPPVGQAVENVLKAQGYLG